MSKCLRLAPSQIAMLSDIFVGAGPNADELPRPHGLLHLLLIEPDPDGPGYRTTLKGDLMLSRLLASEACVDLQTRRDRVRSEERAARLAQRVYDAGALHPTDMHAEVTYRDRHGNKIVAKLFE